MNKLMTQTEYAKHRGCNQSHINRLIKKGIIKLIKGRIDPAQADRAILENEDPSRAEFRRGGGRLATQEPSENSVTAAKVNQIKVATALKNFILKEKIGVLVLANAEKTKGYETAQQVKDGMDNIRDRLTPLLAAETDEHKIRKMLDEEFVELCEGLANGIERN